MPLLPALKPLFAAISQNDRPANIRPVPEARAMAHAAMEQMVTGYYAPAEPMHREMQYNVPVEGGTIAVRLYGPAGNEAALPCHVYFHGGGLLDHFNPLCRALARDAGCIVAAVDYRLEPEQFPVAAEDSYSALLCLAAKADKLGIDPERISVGGVSAGGNLAAVTALMARDRHGPALVLQVLEVPITDLSSHEPLRIPAEGLLIPSGKETYCEHYLSDCTEALLPYVSPLLAPNLAGLPPALIMCAEYDSLAAEGAAYAHRLAEAGIPVDYTCWRGQFHGAQPMAALIPEEAAAYQAQLVGALRRAYGTLDCLG